MKILITGAFGYIGTELLDRLAKKNDLEIIAVDNNTSNIRRSACYILRYPNVIIVNLDISDYNSIKTLPKLDLIVHLAAVVGYNYCSLTPELANLTNVVGTENLALLDTPIIFVSTGSVYGEIGGVCDENVILNPKTLYAKTKLQGEEIVKKASHTILRPATAYGLGFLVRDELLINSFIKAAVSDKKINLYQPNAKRSFYSVSKIAVLLDYTVYNFNKFEGITFNVGCESGNVTKLEICKAISEHVDFELNIIDGQDLDARDYNVSYQKLMKLWPNFDEDLRNNMSRLVDYYKSFAT